MAAVVLLLAGAGLLTAGLHSHEEALPGPAASAFVPPSVTRSTGTATAGSAVRTNPSVVARSTPVALSIPAIGLSVPISTLGLNSDGTVQVPTNFQEPGWFRLGPTPGQMGSAVILGHVDSYQGPAAFFELRTLRAGDRVDVRLADGVNVQFGVYEVATYPKTQFPARQVYGPLGYSGLQLVTCGGQFDSDTGHYLSNVVVYTSLVSATPA